MYEICGTIIHVGAIEEITEKFKKRDLVLRVDGQYPQEIKLQFSQSKCDLLNGFGNMKEVKVRFDIQGRKWESSGKTEWFNTLVGIDINKI